MKKQILSLIVIVLFFTFILNPKAFAEENYLMDESYIYHPKYLPAEILKNKINFPELRIVVIEEKNYLLLQGAEKKIEEAKKALAKIDNENTPYQIKYTLTIIDLSRENGKAFDLFSAAFTSEAGDDVSFLNKDQVIEIYSPSALDSLKFSVSETGNFSQRTARPSVITALGESGNIFFSEEYFGLEEEFHKSDASSLRVNFKPLKLNSDKGIKSEVEVEVNDVRELKTTTWTELGENNLLGLMTLKQHKKSNSIFGEEENIKKRSFAIYLQAEAKTTINNDNSSKKNFSSSLDGADQILFNVDSNQTPQRKNGFQILFGKKRGADLDISLKNAAAGVSGQLCSRGDEFFDLGINFSLRKSLKLGAHLIQQKNEGLSIGFAFDDYVRFGDGFWLAASYLPLIYSFEKKELVTNQGWIEAGYDPGPISFKLRYNSDYKPDDLQLETVFKIKNNFYLAAAAVGDSSGIENYLGGIRFNF